MAKLEGVKTLDMENGEITKIEYNGEVYEKVDTPQKGDIGLFSEDSWVSTAEGGTVFTEINNVDDAGDPQVSYELGSKWYSEYLTYFRKPSTPTLKVGDRVRLISKRPVLGFGGARVGDVGEVRSINGNDIVVDFPNHTYWNGVISEVGPVKAVETSEEQVEAPKVKAGDTIRMVENCPAGGYSTGDTFEVNAVDSEYLIFVDNDGDIRHVSVENGTRYELVPKKQKELFAKVNRPNNTPIPGDYVEFRDSVAKRYSSFLTVGKKYEVEGVDSFGGADITDDNGHYETAETDEIKAIYVKYTQEQAEREPKVGDKVLVVNPHRISTDYEEGDILTVRRLNPHKDVKDGGHFYSEEAIVHLNYDEVVVLNPEQAGADIPNSEEPPKISVKPGDYVINGMGSLGRVDRIEGEWFYGEWLYNEDHPGSFPIGMATANAIKRLATPEEIAKYEEYKAGKEAKKCTQEIEVGDLVRVIDSPGALPEGSVFKVTDVGGYGDIRGRRENSEEYDYYYAPHHVELVAKAEDVYV